MDYRIGQSSTVQVLKYLNFDSSSDMRRLSHVRFADLS